jgi:D-amino peptidase
MFSLCSKRIKGLLALALMLAAATLAAEHTRHPKKVFMITDLEGVDGIFSKELQCIPFESPRFEESRKLLTGEINAAVDGLLEGGASHVVVWDGHDSSRTLSALDIHPKAMLLIGEPASPTLELDSSYSAVVFIGQHAMSGAEKGVLSHSYSAEGIRNIWVNSKPVGEIGARVMLAGAFGIPVIMLSGDTAACREIHELMPQAECAEVKSGVSRTAALSLSHRAAIALIREKTRRAMERLTEFKPYTMTGPVEVKVQFTPKGAHAFSTGNGVEQLDDRTWVFRGKDIIDAWLKYSSF